MNPNEINNNQYNGITPNMNTGNNIPNQMGTNNVNVNPTPIPNSNVVTPSVMPSTNIVTPTPVTTTVNPVGNSGVSEYSTQQANAQTYQNVMPSAQTPTDNGVSIVKLYGENLTTKTYVTNPAIARDEEIRKLMIVLLTPDKSGLLVGKPGIGKTAIVE